MCMQVLCVCLCVLRGKEVCQISRASISPSMLCMYGGSHEVFGCLCQHSVVSIA